MVSNPWKISTSQKYVEINLIPSRVCESRFLPKKQNKKTVILNSDEILLLFPLSNFSLVVVTMLNTTIAGTPCSR